MDGFSEHRTNILAWDVADVHAWFCKLGFPQYEQQIREHNITGDVLCLLDAESLKEVGIATIGQRLAILKAVYNLKVANNIPIEADHYVPPSEAEERQEQPNVEKLYNILREQSDRLRTLEDENRRLSDSLSSCLDDISSVRNSIQLKPNEGSSPVTRQSSFKWASFVKPSRSPTKPTPTPEVVDSPQSSPQRTEYDFNSTSSRAGAASASDKGRQQPSSSSTPPSSYPSNLGASTSNSQLPPPPPSHPKPQRQESSDNLKSFKVSLDDPAWKVLPAALKKYKINNDDWQNYAMFICYGSTGNRIERCLSYDEKPLLLFQKLKDAKKNPVFMLKHIKDIRSPIAVAQQKQAARKANSETSSVKSPPLTGSSGSAHGHGTNPAQGQTSQDLQRSRPPMLQVNSNLNLTSVAPGLMTGVPNAQPGWPEVMSPSVEHKDRADEHLADGPKTNAHGDSSDPPSVAREIPPSTGVSYAVAIYPYMAEQEDEFDVVVGDTFIILSRARGWWVVQRDPAGSGLVEPDMSKQGWVPAGCLLETSVPVATAIAEATTRGHSSSDETPPSPAGKTPILPLSILSTSFPGIALMDYKKKGEEELDLAKDDSLRVFKRYNHWSYAVKEESGDRGWVPSWYIGKVPTQSGVPPTPSTSGAPHNLTSASYSMDGDSRFNTDAIQQAQVSPMSSAFPPMQRTAAVV
ncbi:unnamed protein product [Somion occarium]|uniref:Uncharacterized protein n=1 Tax=Somion occarium TaxID=3059160 RepID=A0ABP1E6D0_9APHY